MRQRFENGAVFRFFKIKKRFVQIKKYVADHNTLSYGVFVVEFVPSLQKKFCLMAGNVPRIKKRGGKEKMPPRRLYLFSK